MSQLSTRKLSLSIVMMDPPIGWTTVLKYRREIVHNAMAVASTDLEGTATNCERHGHGIRCSSIGAPRDAVSRGRMGAWTMG